MFNIRIIIEPTWFDYFMTSLYIQVIFLTAFVCWFKSLFGETNETKKKPGPDSKQRSEIDFNISFED